MLNTYYCLQTALLIIGALCGYILSKRKSKFCFGLIVVSFTLIEGLRFGRGIDYNLYAEGWEKDVPYLNGLEKHPVFSIVEYISYWIGLPFQFIIILCSFILIYGGMKFLIRHRSVLLFSIPLFIYLCHGAENLFRWYTAFGLTLLAYTSYKDRKLGISFIYLILAVGTHYLFLITIIVYVLMLKPQKPIWNNYIAIIVFVLLALLFQTSFMLAFSNLINFYFSFIPGYGNYDDIEGWLTGSNKDETIISFSRYLKFLVFYLPAILIGRKIAFRFKDLMPFFNIYLLGFTLYPAMAKIEIFYRYNQVFIIFVVIFISYAYMGLIKKKIYSCNAMISLIILTSFVLQIYRMSKFYYIPNKWKTMYVWDAKGRTSIDPELLKLDETQEE